MREGAPPPHRVAPLLFRAPEPPPIGLEGRGPTTAPGSGRAAVPPSAQRWSLPADWVAARPASRRATGMRNGEQET